jgi:hypothetical protein
MRQAIGVSGRMAAALLVGAAGLTLLPAGAGGTAAAAQNAPARELTVPPVLPDEKMKNIGVVDPTEIVRQQFVLVNHSAEEVRIRDFRVACNCTRLIASNRTIPPRGAVSVDMTVDLRGDMGRMRKTALIYFQGFDRPIEIGVQGQYQYAVQAPQAPLNPSGTLVSTQIRSSTGRPVRLLSVQGEAPETVSQTPSEGDRILVAEVRKEFGSKEALAHALLVVTDSKESPLAAIRIRSGELSTREMPFVRLMQELNISHKFLNLGVLKRGEAQTYTTTVFRDDHSSPLVGWMPVEGIEVEVVSVEPDPAQEQWPKAQLVTFTVKSTMDRAGATISAPLYMASGTRENPTKLNRVWAAALTADAEGNYIEAIESQGPLLITGDGGEEAIESLGR